ncbi:metal ABC transporter substrate-binding protein [Streptomyces benahoarensis]|uniref:Zinc ABC transporter substrate-binding protein n=1 Tax=Streptomyces benahoarensis TaxID=2595054 RepID=A0A553ZQD6_9ACTN|nr:metal ABC transporter substrate-binding protein [Streptomyces benahoarensis]TSB31786.1 zinc ABC transporter substrate-binding protein [Streptomyces benahoarensis]TSB43684.1 zinc ABC transporter substrate-binding protein [Streptomyces benahoarensis]
MNVRRRIPTAVLAGACGLGLLALSGCSAVTTGGSGGKVRVTASFYPMEFLARQIGGDHVEVSNLTKPGVEPHDLELTPQQTGRLGESDAIVYLKGLQPAVDEAVAQSGVKNVADAATMTSLEEHGAEVDGHHHGHSASGADADPHIWLDPVKYAEVAKGVSATLAKADPAHKADFQKNTDALIKKLDGLNADFRDGLKNRASDTFLTTHAAFGYLAERYGLTEEAINGLDPESEPSANRIKNLHAVAEKHHVSTVFFETLANPATAKALAGDLHLKTDVLDPLEGITDASRGKDYFGVMHANLAALQKALGTK